MKNGTRILWALVVVGVVLYVGLTFWLALSAIVFPYTVDYGEGAMLWFARKMAQGQSIYLTLPGPPFDSSNYPPIATVLTVLADFLVHNALVVGRGLNFIAALIVTALIVAPCAFGIARCARCAVGGGLVYRLDVCLSLDAALSRGLDWAGFCVRRNLFCAALGTAVGERGRVHKPIRRVVSHFDLNLLLALALFLLALYTKHSLLFAPAARSLPSFCGSDGRRLFSLRRSA